MPYSDGNLGGLAARPYPAERNIYGRFGKLYLQPIITAKKDKNQRLGPLQWMSNVTAIQASFNIDKTEVRSVGTPIVRYKPGEFTGEGSLTFDKVNSDFEKIFIDHVAGAVSLGNFDIPIFHLTISLEDGNFSFETTTIDHNLHEFEGAGAKGHEEIILKGVQFWSIPMGYDTTAMVSQDLEFTFQGVDFAGPDGEKVFIQDSNYKFPRRIC